MDRQTRIYHYVYCLKTVYQISFYFFSSCSIIVCSEIKSVLLFQELLDELENAEIPAYIREARLDMLKKHAVNLNEMKEKQHGQYT